jgi:trehalose 6-phosphate phosphatase
MSSESDVEKPQIINVPDFWERLEEAAYKYLALDYDGTLAPFHTKRMEAFPLAGIPELLKQIECREDTTLAIISGRPIFELVGLLGNMSVTMLGSHGFEHRNPHGDTFVRRIFPEQEEGLMMARKIGMEIGLEEHLETKIASIALHTRGLSSGAASQTEDAMYHEWDKLLQRYKLELRRFNGGVELRAEGWNKGEALGRLLHGLSKETFCVYIGDDETDEDAFETVQPYGIGIRVGNPSLPSKANGFLPDIASVKSFLETWKNLATCSE